MKDDLARECVVFTRHLMGREPTDYVVGKYLEYHALPAARSWLQGVGMDRCLLGCARLHPLAARLADSYGRVVLPACTLRKKLILLLAILETCPPFCEDLDRVGQPRSILTFARLTVAILFGMVVFGVALLLFLPCHLFHLVWPFPARRAVHGIAA
jgi:hypothetical protein